jgi:hypothetical protein
VFAEIPDAVLVVAYESLWARRGLQPPPLSATRLRASGLFWIRERVKRESRPVKKTLSEAARALGVSERSLRHRIDAGELETVTLMRGETALEFEPPPQRWHLCPSRLRPDPRRKLVDASG